MKRTAVTGIGVVAPGGTGRDAFWATLVAGHSAVRRISFFDPSGFRSQVAAECDFDPYAAGLDDQDVRRMDRHVQFAVAAALEALRDSFLDLETIETERLGVVMGTAVGGAMAAEEDFVAASNRGRSWLVDPEYASPFLHQALTASSLGSEVAARLGAQGPSQVAGSGSIAGMDAVGRAHRLIQAGRADVVLAGGAEAPISPLVVGSFDQIKATASRFNQTPARASRPFDRERDGFVLGEGAAVLVLEELEHARRRGARVYAEIAGYACRTNAYHMTGLKADGAELAVTIRASLDEARIAPAQVDFVAAHGTGTRQNDRHETAAFKLVLERRAHEIPINSIKSTIGYALGAAGALQLAGAILAMTHGVVPPTINLEHPDPECDLDYTAMTARDHRVGITLATASGFGGLQAATVLARPSEGE